MLGFVGSVVDISWPPTPTVPMTQKNVSRKKNVPASEPRIVTSEAAYGTGFNSASIPTARRYASIFYWNTALQLLLIASGHRQSPASAESPREPLPSSPQLPSACDAERHIWRHYTVVRRTSSPKQQTVFFISLPPPLSKVYLPRPALRFCRQLVCQAQEKKTEEKETRALHS